MARLDKKLARYVSERVGAAEKGQADALYDLGLLYATGHGVDRDYVEAHKWFNLAAMKGMQRAKVDREELAREMRGREVDEALRQARQWQSRH
ncbi:MAG: sel1 repeat family protein [Sphingomonadales bacterium]|nr:sel1 repeat family protein [Sphingomonadales bacterium]